MKLKKNIYKYLSLLIVLLSFLVSCSQRPIIRDAAVNKEKAINKKSSVETISPTGKEEKYKEEPDPVIEEFLKTAGPLPMEKEALFSKKEGPLSIRKLKEEYYIEWDDKNKIFEMAKPYFDAMNIPETGSGEALNKKDLVNLAQKIHLLISMEYKKAENPMDGGYIRFKDDKKDPYTGEDLNVYGALNIEIVLNISLEETNGANSNGLLNNISIAFKNLSDSLPDDSNIGLRLVEGQGSSLIIPLGPKDPKKVDEAFKNIKKAKGGNISFAVKDAGDDLEKFSSDNNTNIILVITDSVKDRLSDDEDRIRTLQEKSPQPLLIITSLGLNRDDEIFLRALSTTAGGSFYPVASPLEAFSPINAMLLTVKDPIKWTSLDEKMLKDLNMQYDSYKYDMKFPDSSERLMLGTLDDLLVENGYISVATRNALYSYFNDYFTFTDNLENDMFTELDLKRAEQLKNYMNKIGSPAILIRRKTANY